MRPVSVTVSAVAISNPIVMDYMKDPFAVGLGVKVTGTITYSVQHTFDDVYDSTVTPTWFDNTSLAAQTANKDGNYAFPVRAIRLNNTAGTGSATLTVIQAG